MVLPAYLFCESNFDCVLVIAGDAGRARTLKSVGASTQWLRKVKTGVNGVAHLQK